MISSYVLCKGFIRTYFHFKRCQENTFTSYFPITLMSPLKVDPAGGWLYFNYWFFVKDCRASEWSSISPDLLLGHKIILSLLSIFLFSFQGDWVRQLTCLWGNLILPRRLRCNSFLMVILFKISLGWYLPLYILLSPKPKTSYLKQQEHDKFSHSNLYSFGIYEIALVNGV